MPPAPELDFAVPAGILHGQRFGSPTAPLAICVPGLSANMKSFDFLGEQLGSDTRQVVAVELRGRGKSSGSPPGTSGWDAHARDLFSVADQLEAEQFSLIGHSMGGAVAMAAAALDTQKRIHRVVLIDICGAPDPPTVPLIDAAVSRLGSVYPSVDAYLAQVKQIGTVEPWSDYFERYLRYELEPAPDGGVVARSSREAVLEDAGEFNRRDIYALWPSLQMPTLLLRANRELLPGKGFIVSGQDYARFAREVPQARTRAIDANHYGIITHPATAEAIAAFLSEVPSA